MSFDSGVIDNGIAIDFSDPELEKLIQDETAMKTVRQWRRHQKA